jgi:hypothetical protein
MSNAWNRPRRTVGVCSNAKLCQSGGTAQDQTLAVATPPKLPIEPPNVLIAVATRTDSALPQLGADLHNTSVRNERASIAVTIEALNLSCVRLATRRLATGALTQPLENANEVMHR